MKVAIPTYEGRISPVFDVARHLLVIEILDGNVVARDELSMEEPGSLSRLRMVVARGAEVLICGAVSQFLEAMTNSAGVTVIARKCGSVEEVLRAFMMGELSEGAFLMPGCRKRCHRRREQRRSGRPRIGD